MKTEVRYVHEYQRLGESEWKYWEYGNWVQNKDVAIKTSKNLQEHYNLPFRVVKQTITSEVVE